MTKKRSLTIVQLYPKDMNIYGDRGNILALQKRAECHGYATKVINYNVGDALPEEVDIFIGGGGQDSGQKRVQEDLQKIAPILRSHADDDTPMLLICGMYQLFGVAFTTRGGEVIHGAGIFDARTYGGDERLIGNIIVESPEFGTIIGYENHSGQTYLAHDVDPLGSVRLGAGNNMKDSVEGARYNNVIGSYLHGSLLPKNPKITDFLIQQAAIKKYGDFTPATIDDSVANLARTFALKRPR